MVTVLYCTTLSVIAVRVDRRWVTPRVPTPGETPWLARRGLGSPSLLAPHLESSYHSGARNFSSVRCHDEVNPVDRAAIGTTYYVDYVTHSGVFSISHGHG
jgi:hypothetical protein